VTGWHGEQWDFQNNEKTMEHSDHWIMTGWHGEQWDFQNNEKTMEILITGLELDQFIYLSARNPSPTASRFCVFIRGKVQTSLRVDASGKFGRSRGL
jgi:hypothetical protein